MKTPDPDLDLRNLLALDLEYRLTIGFRAGRPGTEPCECVEYLIRRRDVLIPEVLERADGEPVDYFAAFARRLHASHQETR